MKDEMENVQCSKLYVELLENSEGKYESAVKIMRMGFDMCGVQRQVNIDFTYKGKIVQWKKYMRVPLELSSILDLIDEEEYVERKDQHTMTFTLYPNNTY